MNVKTKTALVIVFTLIFGIVIGALLNRSLLQKRVERVFSWKQPKVFVKLYMEFIEPKVTQKDQIQEILKRYGKRLKEIRSESRKDLESTMLAMMSELEPFLSSEQLQWLEAKSSSRGGMPTWWDSNKKVFVYLETELALSEDQTIQMKKIFEELRTLRMRSRDKIQEEIPKGRASNFLGLMEKIEEDLKKLLTQTQKEKFDELLEVIRKRSLEENRKENKRD
jgi:hypothetical protein